MCILAQLESSRGSGRCWGGRHGCPPSNDSRVRRADDWLLRDPDVQQLRRDPRFAKVLKASRDGAALVARVLGEARGRGELPAYLSAPLDGLVKLLKENDGAK
jgi:hypothetical protein